MGLFRRLFRSVTQRAEERRRIPWADLLRGIAHMLITVTEPQLANPRPRNNAAAFA